MMEQYNDRIENAKEKQFRLLNRFHIGDYVYPFWLKNFVVYGTVIDIDTVARKIICDFNGVERQFDPEDLMLINPDLSNNKQAMKKASYNRIVNAVYYKSSPSQYKLSKNEEESGEAFCPACKKALQPSFNAETKEVSLVCPDCGKTFDEKNIVEQ